MRHIIFSRARVEEWALRPFSFLSGGPQHWSADATRIDRVGDDLVVRVGQGQIPLPVNALRTVVIRHRRLQAVLVVVGYRIGHIRLRVGRRVFNFWVVARRENQPAMAHRVPHLRHLLQGQRMRPQVLHPNPVLRRLGDFLAQLVAI